MKKVFYLFGLIGILLCYCCSVFKEYNYSRDQVTLFFSKDYDPGFLGKLNIQGYYYLDKRFTSNHVMVFYPDGAYVRCSFKYEYSDSIDRPISNFKKVAEVDYHYRGTGGVYQVRGDTLIVEEHSYGICWNLTRRFFHIVDENTIKLFKDIHIAETNDTVIPRTDVVYRFAPADSLYNIYEIHVKENSYMWDDELDRQEFMKGYNRYVKELNKNVKIRFF